MEINWTSVVLMLFGMVFGFIGYQYKEIHGRLKEDIEKNKQAVVKLEDRIVDMQTRFPKEYASRDDYLRSVANLDTKVDRISNELILINKNIGRLAGGEVYRYAAPYWAMQLGVGKTRPVGRAAQLDCYVRYFWSHTNGASARLNSGETYDFHATDSHRLRAGARYTRRNSASALYAGLALEYEMGNGAAAHFQSYEMPASGAAGVSALMELGWRSAPKYGRVTCEVNLSGWQGRRSGWMGSAYIDWKL